MNFKSLFRVCVLAAMLLPIEAACSLSARPKGKPAADREYDPQTTASFFYTEGIKNNVMEGDTARSIRLFEKVLAIDSTHAPSLYELAILYAGAGAPEKALQYCLRANRLDTGNLWYRGQLGRLLIATNRLDSAMTVYRSLLRADPDNPDNYRLTAALYDQKGEYEQALAVLDSAQSRLGRIEILSSFRRQMLMSMGKYEQAVEEAKATVEDFPYEEQNYVALAELYAMLGLDSLAQRTYDEALALNPGSTPTIISLNEFYKQRKDNVRFLATAELLFRAPELPLETKLKFYDDLIRTPSFYRDNYFQIGKLASALAIAYPHDRRTRELYARHLIAGGNLEEALKLYKAGIDDPEGRREALNNVLDIEAYLNRPDSVAKYAAEATRYYPSDPELYLRKGGVTAFFLKDYAAAEADYKQALKYARSDSLRSVIYGSLGDNCQNRGDYKNCFKYYDKGLRLDTTNAVIYNNYAYFLSLREERLDDALEMARKANRLSPNNPTYLDTYAWVLYMLGRYEEAREPMRLAVSLDRTDSKELLIHYGDILYKLNDRFMAEKVSPIAIAQIGQWAENVYFGKPCGLMDQMASSVGNIITIDFADKANPDVEPVQVDFSKAGLALCILDSGADHADLTDEYAAIPNECRAVAAVCGGEVLRDVPFETFLANIPACRKQCGDRAVLRAFHFYADNDRVPQQVAALREGDFDAFLQMVTASGDSSWEYLQNVIPAGYKEHQEVAVTIAAAKHYLGGKGAVRVHGGGFAGTVQAFVPVEMLADFKANMEKILGAGRCHVLSIRPEGGAVL